MVTNLIVAVEFFYDPTPEVEKKNTSGSIRIATCDDFEIQRDGDCLILRTGVSNKQLQLLCTQKDSPFPNYAIINFRFADGVIVSVRDDFYTDEDELSEKEHVIRVSDPETLLTVAWAEYGKIVYGFRMSDNPKADRSFRSGYQSGICHAKIAYDLKQLMADRKMSLRATSKATGISRRRLTKILHASAMDMNVRELTDIAKGFDIAFTAAFTTFCGIDTKLGAIPSFATEIENLKACQANLS